MEALEPSALNSLARSRHKTSFDHGSPEKCISNKGPRKRKTKNNLENNSNELLKMILQFFCGKRVIFKGNNVILD